MRLLGRKHMGEFREDVLEVRTFGGFSISYNGKSIEGRKNGNSQFAALMQMLIHYKNKGVKREQLEGVLFGDRDVDDVHHALQSVIYNAKVKLKNSGLPKDVNYIEIVDGVVYWTDDIPVWEDATEFDKICRNIDIMEKQRGKDFSECTEKELEEEAKLLNEALMIYKGEFLPAGIITLWIASENQRYELLLRGCVEKIADLFRLKNDYEKLETLGRYISSLQPYGEWECLTMEALVVQGKYDEARDLYADTVERYFEERGLRPSDSLMQSLESLGNQVVHSYEILDDIQLKLVEQREEKKQDPDGAFLCSYPTFRGIYQHLARMLERSGQSICLMSCTIIDSKGNPMKESPALDELAQRLQDTLVVTLRKSDVVNRYGRGQFLVLLINATREDCDIVQKRIDKEFLTSRQRTGIRYHVNGMFMD